MSFKRGITRQKERGRDRYKEGDIERRERDIYIENVRKDKQKKREREREPDTFAIYFTLHLLKISTNCEIYQQENTNKI